MAVGFRKSLLGFHCGDVMDYIKNTQKTFAEKESELNEQVKSLSERLSQTEERSRQLEEENRTLSEKLNDFNDKYDEIERLSENIGKLYLVAQTNAKAMMENTEQNARLADREVEKNLSVLDSAHLSLDELRKSIQQTSDDFLSEINEIIRSLDQTREQVSANTVSGLTAKKQFEELYKTLAK